MLELIYAPVFIRQLNKLEKGLQVETLEKIEMFKDKSNHKILKVHKLHGPLQDCFSFSVNYKYRIVFKPKNSKEIYILSIGDHSIY
jgi:mRNA-degrading endonuclease YafQ of YafQ-DinJ toxin-antitoxin module